MTLIAAAGKGILCALQAVLGLDDAGTGRAWSALSRQGEVHHESHKRTSENHFCRSREARRIGDRQARSGGPSPPPQVRELYGISPMCVICLCLCVCVCGHGTGLDVQCYSSKPCTLAERGIPNCRSLSSPCRPRAHRRIAHMLCCSISVTSRISEAHLWKFRLTSVWRR